MSTRIWQMETRFAILADKVGAAYNALKGENLVRGQDRQGNPQYHIHPKDITRSLDLEELVGLWEHRITLDPQGNVTNTNKDDFYDEDITAKLFATLAPFVSPGSFVEYMNEYGDHWRWWFDGRTTHRQVGRVVFDDVPTGA